MSENVENTKNSEIVVDSLKQNSESPTDVMKRSKKVKRLVKRTRGDGKPHQEEREFDKRIIKIRRVTRVYKGGKRMRLSVFLAVGDKKGRVGIGLGKGADVKTAEEKAYAAAVKNMVMISLKGRTIPHDIENKHKASKIILKPAAPGTGIIAGASVRAVVELAGVQDILTKRIGTKNSISVAQAAFETLKLLRTSRL